MNFVFFLLQLTILAALKLTWAKDQNIIFVAEKWEKKLNIINAEIWETRLKILPVLTREHYTSLLHWV
jgi:hypothetical protein